MSDVAQKSTINRIRFSDIKECLKFGLKDFLRAPQFGLFFSAIYVVGGFLMLWLGSGHVTWILATSLGFPLVAPFAAAGLYEVSRRLEKAEPLDWRSVLGVIWHERTRQLPWLGAIIVFYFLVWTFLAHMIFALFMGLAPMINISQSWDVLWTPNGIAMLAVEFGIGFVLAFLLFSLTVVSLPMVLDREVDFVTAMITSVQAVSRNFTVMLLWAVIIGVGTFLAMLPWFLGLMIALPVFGHATWHMYRKLLT